MKQIIGRKIGMTQVYAEDGTMYAVTVVEVLPNVVTQKKTLEKDGYEAIQIGYEDKKECSGFTKRRNKVTKKRIRRGIMNATCCKYNQILSYPTTDNTIIR